MVVAFVIFFVVASAVDVMHVNDKLDALADPTLRRR